VQQIRNKTFHHKVPSAIGTQQRRDYPAQRRAGREGERVANFAFLTMIAIRQG
jgi:hypothetical protein